MEKKIISSIANVNLIILLITILSFSHCSKEKDIKGSHFINKFNVKSNVVIHSDKLTDPTIIEILDSLIIISNYKAEPLLEIYDFSGNLKKKAISKGKGPFEILSTGRIQVNNKEKTFYINDLFAKKVIKINLYELLNDKDFSPSLIFNPNFFNQKNKANYDKILVNKNFFIGENRSPEGRLVFMNQKGEPLNYYIKIPGKDNVNSNLSDFGNASLYASTVTMNPKCDKIAMATYSAGMIDLFDIKSKSLIWSYNDFFPNGIDAIPMGDDIVPVHTGESKTGYLDISATNDLVYALYSGKFIKEKDYGYGNIVRIVDWKGIRSLELYLDRDIRRLAISSDNKKMYGVSKNINGEPEVIVFDISNIKII